MDKINVQDFPDLCRDLKSNAIVNKNKIEYENYMRNYRHRMTEKEKISNIESDLDDLKSQINEIKNLLINLTNNK